MRINSLHKIELQALEYSRNNPAKLRENWELEFDTIQKEYNALVMEWRKYENQCPADKGGICTCREHPKYHELVEVKQHNVAQYLRDLYEERTAAQAVIYQGYRDMLIRGRKAKLEYQKRFLK